MSQCACCMRPYPQECFVKILAPQLQNFNQPNNSDQHKYDQLDLTTRELCGLIEKCQTTQENQAVKILKISKSLRNYLKLSDLDSIREAQQRFGEQIEIFRQNESQVQQLIMTQQADFKAQNRSLVKKIEFLQSENLQFQQKFELQNQSMVVLQQQLQEIQQILASKPVQNTKEIVYCQQSQTNSRIELPELKNAYCQYDLPIEVTNNKSFVNSKLNKTEVNCNKSVQNYHENMSRSIQNSALEFNSFQAQKDPFTNSTATSPLVVIPQQQLNSEVFSQQISSPQVYYQQGIQPTPQFQQTNSSQNYQQPIQTAQSPSNNQPFLVIDQKTYENYLKSISSNQQNSQQLQTTQQQPMLSNFPLTSTDEAFAKLNHELDQKFENLEINDFSQFNPKLTQKPKLNDSLQSSYYVPQQSIVKSNHPSINERGKSESQNTTQFYQKSSSSGNKSDQKVLNFADLRQQESQIPAVQQQNYTDENIVQSSQSAQQLEHLKSLYRQEQEQRGMVLSPDQQSLHSTIHTVQPVISSSEIPLASQQPNYVNSVPTNLVYSQNSLQGQQEQLISKYSVKFTEPEVVPSQQVSMQNHQNVANVSQSSSIISVINKPSSLTHEQQVSSQLPQQQFSNVSYTLLNNQLQSNASQIAQPQLNLEPTQILQKLYPPADSKQLAQHNSDPVRTLHSTQNQSKQLYSVPIQGNSRQSTSQLASSQHLAVVDVKSPAKSNLNQSQRVQGSNQLNQQQTNTQVQNQITNEQHSQNNQHIMLDVGSEQQRNIPKQVPQNNQQTNCDLENLFKDVLANKQDSIHSQLEEIQSLTAHALEVSLGTEKRQNTEIIPLQQRLIGKVDSAFKYVKQLRSEGNSVDFSGIE